MQLSSVDIVFLSIVVIFAVLIVLAGWIFARSPVIAAHENMAKAGKYVAEAFVSITMFYMLFYLTLKGYKGLSL
jgi:hypothetical protein